MMPLTLYASEQLLAKELRVSDAGFAWGDEIVESVVRGVPCRVYARTRTTLGDLLLDARRWGDRTAVVHGDRRLSFRRHETAIRATAAKLTKMGVKPGDRVLLLAPNSIEWVVLMWATFVAGGVAVLGNFWWSAAEVEQAIADTSPTLICVDEKRLSLLPSSDDAFLMQSVAVTAADSAEAATPDVNISTDDPAVIVFTSGSTGRPKGAVLSHRNVISAQHSLLLRTNRLPSTIPDDQVPVVSLLTGPLFHLGGFGPLMTALLVGGSVIFLEGKFDSGQVLDLIERERVTLWGAVPTMVARVLTDASLTERDTSSVRTVGLGGAPVPPELPARIRQAFPNASRGVSEMWGMTEASGLLTSAGGRAVLEHPGTSGKPIPVVELRILDPDADGAGEVIVKGPGVMLGYSNRPEENPIDEQGFLHTGDVGRLDEDGYLYLTGRSKDVIIRGGENISCSHVEECLATHPDVLEVAVVPVPHAELGEEVGAVVQVRPESTVTVADLRSHAARTLAYFEVPSRWRRTEHPLPTTPFGKIDKKQIRANWAATGQLWADETNAAPGGTR